MIADLLMDFSPAPAMRQLKKFNYFFGPYSPNTNVQKHMKYNVPTIDRPNPYNHIYNKNVHFGDHTIVL